MKKVILILLFLITLSTHSYANEIIVRDDGNHIIKKTFEAALASNPNSFVEPDFKQDGYLFSKSDISKTDIHDTETIPQTKTTELSTSSNNKDAILKKLDKQIEFNEDGFTGILILNEQSIKTVAKGYANKSFNVSETKEYSGLSRNDPYLVPKTITKDGLTLTLSNISWHEQGGNEEQPLFKATASYSGTGSSKYATGYITTAEYSGEVSKPVIRGVTYTITYVGKKLFPVKIVIVFSSIILLTGIIFLLIILFIRRKNVRIFNLQNNQYILIGKERLSCKHPEIDLNKQYRATSDQFAVVLNRGTTKKLFGKQITVAHKDEKLYYMVEGYNTEFWFKVGEAHEE